MLSLPQFSVAEPLPAHSQPDRPCRPLNPAAFSGWIRSGCWRTDPVQRCPHLVNTHRLAAGYTRMLCWTMTYSIGSIRRTCAHVHAPQGSFSVGIHCFHVASQRSSYGSMREQILEQNPTIYHCQRVPPAYRLLQERVGFFKGTCAAPWVPLALSNQHLCWLFSDHIKNYVCLKEAANRMSGDKYQQSWELSAAVSKGYTCIPAPTHHLALLNFL